MRAVSLLPSATEIVALVGGPECIVGVSHECNYPPGLNVPALTGAFTEFQSSRQIHDAVNFQLAAGQGLYWVDEKKLSSLNPDLIVTQSLCEVCSVDLTVVAKIAKRMARTSGHEPKVISLNPSCIQDVLQDCKAVGDAMGMPEAGAKAAQALQDRVERAQRLVKQFKSTSQSPNVCVLEWTDPFFIGGHWTPQLVEMAGGSHPLNPCRNNGGAGKSIAVENELVEESDPDWIIICPCGFDMEMTQKEMAPLESEDWWRNLRAVRENKVVLVDGNQMFNRPGPRLVDALEWLVGLLHDRPDLMPPDFPWAPYELPAAKS